MRSIVYWNAFSYNIIMRLLYPGGFKDRYAKLAALIPDDVSVVEICCGDCYLYRNYLSEKKIKYTGLDINPSFIAKAKKNGIDVYRFDLNQAKEIPKAEYLIMQASLYQFLPDAAGLMKKLLAAAQKKVIIAEPVKNLSTSQNSLTRFIAKRLSNPGTHHQMERFNEQSFVAFCNAFSDGLTSISASANGKELIAVFDVRKYRRERLIE